MELFVESAESEVVESGDSAKITGMKTQRKVSNFYNKNRPNQKEELEKIICRNFGTCLWKMFED